MITPEEAEEIKENLLNQLENFPEDKRAFIKEKILSMSEEELENFLNQNELASKTECVLCSIASEKIASFKIAEDSENVAVLEINPINRGHTLIIPKNHSNTSPESSEQFAKEVAEKIRKKLSPRDIKISKNTIMGHALLEVIPFFGNEKERKKATPEELKSTQNLILKEEEKKVQVEEVPEVKESPVLPKLKPRIP
jgi:diadenosine tetraphosphate (Ap4A) HIT family hydrolase